MGYIRSGAVNSTFDFLIGTSDGRRTPFLLGYGSKLAARTTWTVGPTSLCFRACRASAETGIFSVQIHPPQHSIGFPICFSIPALLVNRQAADRLKTDEPQAIEAQD
jgi:hypothetical protein